MDEPVRHGETWSEYVSTSVEPSLKEALIALARRHDRTIAAEARVAIRSYVTQLSANGQDNSAIEGARE
jgi:hypothetical protein